MVMITVLVRAATFASVIAGSQPSLADVLSQRAQWYSQRAAFHRAERAAIDISDLEFFLVLTPVQIGIGDISEELREKIRDEQEMSEHDAQPLLAITRYHQKLMDRYAFAARYPWLPLLPEPPQPRTPSRKEQRMFRLLYLPRHEGSPDHAAPMPAQAADPDEHFLEGFLRDWLGIVDGATVSL